MSEPYYVVIDTETGGVNPQQNSLLQLGMLITDRDFKIIKAAQWHIRSRDDRFETQEAFKVNGIDLAKHNADPTTLDPREAAGRIDWELWDATGGNADRFRLTPCGWNPAFDVGFIKQLDIDWGKYCTYFNYDIASIAQYAKRQGIIPDDLRGLHATAKWCGIANTEGMLIDADITRQLAIYLNA